MFIQSCTDSGGAKPYTKSLLCLLVKIVVFALYSPPWTWQGGWRWSLENKAISQVTVVLTTHLYDTNNHPYTTS